MAAPVAGEPNSPLQNSDRQLIDNEHTSLSGSTEADFTISQLATSKSPNHNPNFGSSSLGKRKKSKPIRYRDSTTGEKKTQSPLQLNIEQNSATKSPMGSQPAMIRAGEIKASLGTEHPICIKMVVKAHVDPGYWMGFPQYYGKLFLPKTDTEMEIEAENGEIHHIKYIADKSGLSAGWKKFAVINNLREGDVLVFHLLESSKFKVYIVRTNDQNEVDGDNTPSSKTNGNKKCKILSPQLLEQSGNNSEEVGSELLEGSRPNLSFQELKNFRDFHIMVKGVCIDSELPEDVRMNYYKLCMCRKEFLHDHLSGNLYNKLVAGMIGETVKIGYEIKNCKLTITKAELEAWDKSLNSFAILGMKVGFLRDKIGMILKVVGGSEGDLDVEKYVEAKNKQKSVECEIVSLTRKLVDLKEASGRLKGVLEGLKEKVGMHDVKFQQAVDVPW